MKKKEIDVSAAPGFEKFKKLGEQIGVHSFVCVSVCVCVRMMMFMVLYMFIMARITMRAISTSQDIPTKKVTSFACPHHSLALDSLEHRA